MQTTNCRDSESRMSEQQIRNQQDASSPRTVPRHELSGTRYGKHAHRWAYQWPWRGHAIPSCVCLSVCLSLCLSVTLTMSPKRASRTTTAGAQSRVMDRLIY